MSEPVRHPRIDFRLYLITDRKTTRDRDLAPVVEEALKGGITAVQLREKDLASNELYATACAIRAVTSRYGARLFINDRIDIALAVNADGVHLGVGSIPLDQARTILGENKLIGFSCHDRGSAVAAQEKGADFITFGPVFPTPSKAAYGDPVGVGELENMTKLLRIPVFALGGINRDSAPQAMSAGAHGIALISAIMAAANPREEAEALLSLLPAAQRQED